MARYRAAIELGSGVGAGGADGTDEDAEMKAIGERQRLRPYAGCSTNGFVEMPSSLSSGSGCGLNESVGAIAFSS